MIIMFKIFVQSVAINLSAVIKNFNETKCSREKLLTTEMLISFLL